MKRPARWGGDAFSEFAPFSGEEFAAWEAEHGALPKGRALRQAREDELMAGLDAVEVAQTIDHPPMGTPNPLQFRLTAAREAVERLAALDTYRGWHAERVAQETERVTERAARRVATLERKEARRKAAEAGRVERVRERIAGREARAAAREAMLVARAIRREAQAQRQAEQAERVSQHAATREQRVGRAVEAYQRGDNPVDIGGRLGVSSHTIRKYLKEAGVYVERGEVRPEPPAPEPPPEPVVLLPPVPTTGVEAQRAAARRERDKFWASMAPKHPGLYNISGPSQSAGINPQRSETDDRS